MTFHHSPEPCDLFVEVPHCWLWVIARDFDHNLQRKWTSKNEANPRLAWQKKSYAQVRVNAKLHKEIALRGVVSKLPRIHGRLE